MGELRGQRGSGCGCAAVDNAVEVRRFARGVTSWFVVGHSGTGISGVWCSLWVIDNEGVVYKDKPVSTD